MNLRCDGFALAKDHYDVAEWLWNEKNVIKTSKEAVKYLKDEIVTAKIKV